MTDPVSMPPRKLALAVAGSALAAALILFGAVIPAEFGRDPLGLGRLSGLIRLWAPDEVRVDPDAGTMPRAREYPTGFRTDVIEIPLSSIARSAEGYQLEYKVAMRKDATLIYQWEAVGLPQPDDLYYDFHGHTLAAGPGTKVTVATYRQAMGGKAQGALTAPFDGIHGWFFQNAANVPVTVRVTLAGFYELIPPGEAGNEAGIAPSLDQPANK